MTNQMPLEGFQDHDHDHPHDHLHDQRVEVEQPGPTPDEAIQAGAQAWLAREFVGGLVAMAQASDIDVADFLADKCVILAIRTARSEAEVQVLRTQLQAVTTESAGLQRQLDDCAGSHADPVQADAVFGSLNTTINGDASH